MAKNRSLMERWRKSKIRARRARPRMFSSTSRVNGPLSQLINQRENSLLNCSHKLLQALFKLDDMVNKTSLEDPVLAIESKLKQLASLSQDGKYLSFNFIVVDGDLDSDYCVVFYFGGNEYFFVERRFSLLRRSIVYGDRDRAWSRYDNNTLSWKPYVKTPTSILTARPLPS